MWLRAIQTPRTTARTITSRVATRVMFRVIIASCHRSKYQMPARQMTVDTTARIPPSTAAIAMMARAASHQGDSASSSCIGFSSTELMKFLKAPAGPSRTSTT